MALLSGGLLSVLAALSLVLPVFAVLCWPRMRGPRAARFVQRFSLVLVCQVAAVALVGSWVNDQFAFYVSWHDLLGTPAAVGPVVQNASAGLTAAAGPLPQGRLLQGGIRELDLLVHGHASGATEPVKVYLPAGYDAPANRGRRYPVVELLAGYHGTPQSWDDAMHVPDVLTREVQAGRVQPFIAVAPAVDLLLPRDIECNDVPDRAKGKAETWLGRDIRSLVLSRFRAQPARRSWGLVGYSSGGYCAVKLLLHHPQWYSAVVAMDASFYAVKDASTGELWGSSPVRREHNDPVWLLQHGVHPDADVLVFTSRQDAESYRPTLAFLEAARAPLRTYELIAATGGHNLRALSLALPEMVDWLSAHLQPGRSLSAVAPPHPAPVRPG